jgi:hypothetical protein
MVGYVVYAIHAIESWFMQSCICISPTVSRFPILRRAPSSVMCQDNAGDERCLVALCPVSPKPRLRGGCNPRRGTDKNRQPPPLCPTDQEEFGPAISGPQMPGDPSCESYLSRYISTIPIACEQHLPVMVNPGATQLTLIPLLAYSTAVLVDKCAQAAFDASYAAPARCARMPAS